MAFDLNKIDIIKAAEDGVEFKILDLEANETDLVIKIRGIACRAAKIANLKYEQEVKKIQKEFGITEKQLEKPENLDPEKLVDYTSAVDEAYVKIVLAPLTISIDGLEKDGEPVVLAGDEIFELYKAYPWISHQVSSRFKDVKGVVTKK